MIQKIWNKYSTSLTDFFLFILSLYTSLFFSMLIKRPYSNSDGIANQFNVIGFNPDSNYLQIVFVLVATILLFYGLKYVHGSRYAWAIKLLPIGLLLTHFVFSELLKFTVGYAFGQGALDTFHSGEQLSPTAAFLSGSSLYTDLFFFRGAAVDVLFSALGFKLFGESIGAFVLINHIYMFLTLLGFLLLLAFLIRNTMLFTITASLFYVSTAVVLTQPRDLPVYIVIGLVFFLFKPQVSYRAKAITLGLIGLISGLEMYIAVDRGISLVGLSLLLFVILHLLTVSSANAYTFKPIKIKRFEWLQKELWWLPAGLAVGFFIPGLFLGINGFISFLKLSFVDIPAYGGLLVAQPFPDFFTPGYVMWGPVLLAVTTSVLLIQLVRHFHKNQLNILIPLSLLLIYGVIALKFGSNRIDIAKMASVAAPLFLASVMIIALAIALAYKNTRVRPHVVTPLILSIITILTFSYVDLGTLLNRPVVTKADVKAYVNTVRSKDDTWMNPELINVRKYIQSKTSGNDYIFAFTSDPIYYYITDRKNPTRFYISWYADPQPYTNEMLKDLKRNPPKLIIYSNGGPWDKPDNILMKDRIPEVDRWIQDNYKKKTVVDSTLILESN